MGEEFKAKMRQAGTAEIITIFDPRKAVRLTIYPRLRSYVQISLPNEQADELKRRPTAQTIEVGKETIDGRPCVKFKVSFPEENDRNRSVAWGLIDNGLEGFVWRATDLKGLPVRLELLGEGDQKMALLFKDIKSARPDSKLFEPPADYEKFDSFDAFVQAKVKFPEKP